MSKQHVEAGRVGAAVTLHLYGREHYRALRERSTTMQRYGTSEAAQRQWMRDIAAKRRLCKEHGPEEGAKRWQALVARHTAQFGRDVTAKAPR